MKKLLLSVMLGIVTLTAFAKEYGHVMLRLSLSDHSPIAVNLDGHFIDRQTISLSLDGLEAGYHRLSVFSIIDGRRPLRLYTGTLRLEANTENSGIVDVDRRMLSLRTVSLDERAEEQPADQPPSNEGPAYRNPNDQNDYGDDRGKGDREMPAESAQPIDQPGFGSFPRGRRNTASPTTRAGSFNQRDMDDLQDRVDGLTTDTDKEKLMKSALSNHVVNTDEVRGMLSWLSFESTRLDFAIWAYEQVDDKENYWKLEDAFSYSDSKEEFNKAISEQR